MGCVAKVNLRSGLVEVSGGNAGEVQAVMLSMTTHLNDFARAHPSILEPLAQLTEVHTGDRIQITGNVGAVGRGAAVAIEMPVLAADLSNLRRELRSRAETPQDDLELAELAKAQIAADNEDEPGVLAALKALGHRTLEVAQGIGASVATAAISKALGV